MILMVYCFQVQVVAADVIVIPRSRSCAIQSIAVVPLVNTADLVYSAGEIQHALGNRRLTGIDVRYETDISGIFQDLLVHRLVAFSISPTGESVLFCTF